MSGRRRRSESLWDRKEDSLTQTEISENIPSNFHGDGSPKRSNSEGNDILMSDDFSRQQFREPTDNERHRMKTDSAIDESENQYSSRPSHDSYNLPYRGRDRGVVADDTKNMSKDRNRSRSRSRSPPRNRGRDQDRGQGRAKSPFRGGASRPDNEHSGGSRFQDDRGFGDNPRSKGSDGYRKDNARNEARDYPRKDNVRNEETSNYPKSNRSGYDDHDRRRQSNQSVKTPCRFFMMGNCNRSHCKFSHDPPSSGGHERRSHDNIPGSNTGDNNPWIENHAGFSDIPNSNPNFDDKHKSWNDPSWNNIEAGGFEELDIASNQFPSNLNGNGGDLQSNGSVQGILTHLGLQNQTDIQTKEDEKLLQNSKNDIPQIMSTDQVSQLPQNVILANALNLLHSLPNPVDSTVVNEPVKINAPSEVKVNENPVKPKTQGKVDESDEKAMRQFKIALVDFVKEILKPTWKEGKMSKEDYKTIVKKVVEKVTSTIQGIQIPRTQEKIDHYLAFSKSKITKLVEAYVGRFQKA